ncbi:MAG TPA: hypothetical protein VJA21_24285 [Verrucomicrobiae bacterium]
MALLTTLLCAPNAPAQPANEPLARFVVTDGAVYAMAKTNNLLYFGGLFSLVGVRSGSAAPVSADTGVPEPVFPIISGEVLAGAPDGQGGWFLGGSFTVAGEFMRTNLVHIRSDRTVDPNWAPSASGGWVDALVLSGGKLYLGGSFTNVNGATRNRAAAIDSASGALAEWNPNLNGAVRTMVLDGTNIFLGGEFTTVNARPYSYLAAVDPSTGNARSWNPMANDFVQSLVISGGHLYAGGYFDTMGGQSRSCAASFDLSSFTLDPWDPKVGGLGIVQPVVFAVAAYQNSIFLAGVFGSAGTSNRVNIAAIDTTTGLATAWDAKQLVTGSSGIPTVQVYSMTVYGSSLYVGGLLGTIGGQSRPYAAALDLNTGDATAWDPKANMQAVTFCGVGNTIYLGGLFGALGCVPRTNAAAFDLASSQVTDWNPGVGVRSGVPVSAMAVANDQVFIGGFFTNVGGLTRSNLAAVDAATGAVSDWAPNPGGTVYALAAWNDRLYAGGSFRGIAGINQTNFAEFDLSSGVLTGWNPDVRPFVQALAVKGDTLYVGGIFSQVSGQTHRRIAAFDLTSQTLLAWDPGITNGSSVAAIATYGNTVYIGGRFNVISGNNRTNFAAIDATTAQVLPLVANTDSQPIYSLAATSNLVFMVGNFSSIAGQKRSYVAALDVNANALTSWNPNADFYAETLQVFDNVLYVGGAFLRLGGETTRGIAAYPLSLTERPEIISNSMKFAAGSASFRLKAPGVPQATVLASSNLTDWLPLQTVPLSIGYGQCFDADATNHPVRFYRVSVP